MPAFQPKAPHGTSIKSAVWASCGGFASQHIQLGDADIVAAGGQESMTLSPHVAHLRAGQKMVTFHISIL